MQSVTATRPHESSSSCMSSTIVILHIKHHRDELILHTALHVQLHGKYLRKFSPSHIALLNKISIKLWRYFCSYFFSLCI